MSQIHVWLGKLISADNPPTLFKDCAERLRHWSKATCEDGRTQDEMEPNYPFEIDDDDVELVLSIIQESVETTPQMLELMKRWTAQRSLGADCPPDRVPLLPRESGVYQTQITAATPEEKVAMAAYDKAVDAALDTVKHRGTALLMVAVMLCYAFQLAGFESAFTKRAMVAFKNMPNHNARRQIIGMPDNFEFETPDVEAMTLASSTIDEPPAGIKIPDADQNIATAASATQTPPAGDTK